MNKDMFNNKYRIKSIRLPYWDYHNVWYYFVTICTKDRQHYLGNIKNDEMLLSDIGKIAHQYRLDIPKHFPHVSLDTFVIMPNHLHWIISINEKINENKINKNIIGNAVETQNIASPKINEIKNIASPKINEIKQYGDDFKETHNHAPLPITTNNKNPNIFWPQIKNLWSIIRGFKSAVTTYAKIHTIEFARQPWYYENIIRTIDAHKKISEYIENNPKQWNNDKHYI